MNLSPFWVNVIYAIILARRRQLLIKTRCLNYLWVFLIPYCYQELQRDVNGSELWAGRGGARGTPPELKRHLPLG